MPHLIYLTTTKFAGTKEEPNPYNPIAGKGLLSWLREQLSKVGWEVTEPDAEDWGWYIFAQKNGASYMIGANGELDDEKMPIDWIIQIRKNRKFMEKLTGKNKLLDDDVLTREIESIVRHEPGTTKVEVDLTSR
jgi:hypothetical protein